jgi:hypothetical protein
LALNIYLWKWTRVPFTWYVTLGSLMTFAVGFGASLIENNNLMPANAEPLEADASHGN